MTEATTNSLVKFVTVGVWTIRRTVDTVPTSVQYEISIDDTGRKEEDVLLILHTVYYIFYSAYCL